MYKTYFGTLRPVGSNCMRFYMMKCWQGTDALQKTHVATNRTNSAFNSVFLNLWKIVKEVVINMFI